MGGGEVGLGGGVWWEEEHFLNVRNIGKCLSQNLVKCVIFMYFLHVLGAALFPFNAEGFRISCRRRHHVLHDLSTSGE